VANWRRRLKKYVSVTKSASTRSPTIVAKAASISPAQARVAAAGMLLDRGWGKAHQTGDVNVNETQHYVRAPSKVSDDAWKRVLEQRQATLESLVPKPKPKPIEAKPNGNKTPFPN
jgi:hypothetical protein